ncbi:hypothetical protein BGZ63DRAFT_469361 [Mariannaea sp. PMI_226]|nr:hypothetical protein BGZ63DRAFT_469361 [Mariannaea sp. PMI_226]
MAFGKLVPELLFIILQDIDSPLDLYHLISASPSCFRAFSNSPVLILSSIIKNAFHGENIQHALAILQVPATTSQVSSFLNKYFNSPASFDFPTNKAELVNLCLLYNRLSYFLGEYSEEKTQEFGLSDQLSYSPSERVRLQRAFLRFELYCKVFPDVQTDPNGLNIPPPQDPPPEPADQQFSLFLANLTPWEVEEMCCVEQHFYSLIGKFIDELEEELIDAVMTAPGVVLPLAADEEPTPKTSDQDNLVNFAALDLTPLMLFSRDSRWESPSSISYMTALGLDFMHSLLVSDKSKRTQLIQSNHPVTREFLPQALSYAPRETPEPERHVTTAAEIPLDDDNPSNKNLGYRLFGDTNYIGITHSGSKYTMLRQLGYVFWDSIRIQSPGVFEKLSAAKAMSWDEIYQRFDRRQDLKSAEVLLRGTRLPWEQMRRLHKEFGIVDGYEDD